MRHYILLLSVAFILLIFSPGALGADMAEVHLVKVRGTEYQVTEVEARTRERISRWNMLIGKRGKKIVRFKLLGNDNPLTVDESEVNAAELKTIPDFRPFEAKYPYRAFTAKQGPNIVLTFITLFVR